MRDLCALYALCLFMVSNAELTVMLNDLLAICYNSEKGYAVAFSRAKNPMLRSLLEEYSRQRADFILPLQREVERIDGMAETGGDLAGMIHRLWIRLKSIFLRSDEAIVAECLFGEVAALEVYEEARHKPLPLPIQETVDEQHETIRAARDRLLALHQAGLRPVRQRKI